MISMVVLAATLQAAPRAEAEKTPVEAEVERSLLPPGGAQSTWVSAYRKIDELDARADRAWRALETRSDYDAYRKALREKMIAAIGGFPERTPLNARTLSAVERATYRIEKVVFESMPGLYVTANLFLPKGAATPHPAIVMSCGHADTGKDCDDYLHACVLAAKRGMAAFMFDPYEQGERRQYPEGGSCRMHNLIGLKAMLLGWSMSMLRAWDGIRAVDYVTSRPEIDPDRIGYMGQSGGGTMTALMTALDWRLKATAPSCYLTSLGYLCRIMGPQDAEQNIFGQLAFGLNHTGYVLLPDTKVCITGRYSDMFPWGGVAQLYRTVQDVAVKVGASDHYALNFAPGPHGWTESTECASVDWMAAWLKGEKGLLPLDMPKYMAMDLGFRMADAEHGLEGDGRGVTPERDTMKLAGARDIHGILRERFAAARAKRPVGKPAETAARVIRLAGIVPPSAIRTTVRSSAAVRTNGVAITRFGFMRPDGLTIPAALVEGESPDASAAPTLMIGTKGRAAFAEEAAALARKGGSVLIADVSGTGEIGSDIRANGFYGSKGVPEEGAAVMMYLVGESMTGHRATDILVLADWLKTRAGVSPRIVAEGSTAIAAAHAYAADRSLVSDVEVREPPPSWTEFVEKPGEPLPYYYAWTVNGALLDYDWTDLLPR